MTIVCETPRLRVRHLREGDLEALATICGDAELMRYVGDGTPLAREAVERWIEVSLRNYERQGFGNWAVEEKSTGEMIGYCGLVRAPGSEEVEIVYAYLPRTHGKGIASEAAAAVLEAGFERFGLGRVLATIDPENPASIRIAEKLGMRYWKEEPDENGLPTLYFVKDRD